MAKAYLAPSLVQLRNEIKSKWPDRDMRSDGWIGDKAHRNRKSEHNPDSKGCVHAIDVDKDRMDVKALLKAVIGDHRVWYVIFNRRMYSRSSGFKARAYNGANPHTEHVHISIKLTSAAERDTRRWFGEATPVKPPTGKWRSYAKVTAGSRIIREWDRGDDVKELQRILSSWYPDQRIGTDGYFGANTTSLVKYFQTRTGIISDGVVGPQTWRKLGVGGG